PGQVVTFTATVAAVAPGAGTPTGTVTFKDGNVILGTVAVGAGGRATFMTSFAASGGHAITAVYNTDPNFAGSSQSLTEQVNAATTGLQQGGFESPRSEEHTSELQSRSDLVCRLLLEKKKKRQYNLRL